MTRHFEINGFVSTKQEFLRYATIYGQFTNSIGGSTLSLADDKSGVQITIPYDTLKEIIEVLKHEPNN